MQGEAPFLTPTPSSLPEMVWSPLVVDIGVTLSLGVLWGLWEKCQLWGPQEPLFDQALGKQLGKIRQSLP